ncbi:MAG TPA: hypothetical protein VMG12_01975, partial [Polyangiaceae bacterium]|nr:hypothetical protein [Polyangiaceae bacterium]
MTSASELAQQWEQLDAGVPLALLPVRLETRFMGGELLIRIEPDVLQHDLHVGVLRPDERALGEQFWTAIAAAGDRAEPRTSAWRTLAGALGPWRAAWVARAVRLGAPDGAERGRPALARLLPQRWVARAWFAGKAVTLGWSQPVRAPLQLGFDLDDPSWTDAAAHEADERAGRLSVDPAARWMINFEAAEAAGMAIRATLAEFPQLEAHLLGDGAIDELLVVGVDPALDAEKAGERLAALLEAQRYTRGLELVPQGVPTNNTEQVETGISPNKPDLDGLLQRELGAWLPAAPVAPQRDPKATPEPVPARVGPRTLGGRLARALGLDPAALVQRLEQAGAREDEGAAAMNRLLWPLTWGELFGNLLAGVEKPAQNRLLEPSALGPLENWFVDNVRGGSSIGTLRVGPQPFGVLPVRRLPPREKVTAAASLAQHIGGAVDRLRDTWRQVLPLAPTTLGEGDAASANAALLRVLGSQPHPWEFTVQRASDCRKVLGSEYASASYNSALHLPALVLMPGWRFGESSHVTLKFILDVGSSLSPSTDNLLFGVLACWAALLFSETKDRLPEVLATPDSALKEELKAKAMPQTWIDAWALDAIIWRVALNGKPLPARPRSIDDLIGYVTWLAGDENGFVEALQPKGVWAAYVFELVRRCNALEGTSGGASSALLAHCRMLSDRIGALGSDGPTSLLRKARAALELHRQRIAPLEPWYAQWGRSQRLLSHIQDDGPTAAFLAYEDADIGVIDPKAPLVQAPGADAGDRASAYLAELASSSAGSGWDAARVSGFTAAAKTAKKPAGLKDFRAREMSGDRPPPLLFQLGRAALAATEGNARTRVQKQLDTLAALAPDELELRLRESLGLGTHRLDAWATALAAEAL